MVIYGIRNPTSQYVGQSAVVQQSCNQEILRLHRCCMGHVFLFSAVWFQTISPFSVSNDFVLLLEKKRIKIGTKTRLKLERNVLINLKRRRLNDFRDAYQLTFFSFSYVIAPFLRGGLGVGLGVAKGCFLASLGSTPWDLVSSVVGPDK